MNLRTLFARPVLGLCSLISVLLLGRHRRRVDDPKKVVIYQLAKLGDMVCTTPVFRAIKNNYPESKVIVVGNSQNELLLAGNKDVDFYIKFVGIWSTIRIIRKYRADFGIITSPNIVGLSVLVLGGVRAIAGFSIVSGSVYEDIWYKSMRPFFHVFPYHFGEYVPGAYLSLLRPLGINSTNTKKYLTYSEEADQRINKIFFDMGILNGIQKVAILPGVGNKIKRWPVERFAELALKIVRHCNAQVLIFGGKRDADEVLALRSCLQHRKNIFYIDTEMTIDELKCLIAHLDLLISVDSGPIYIAESFGVATVDIVGPVDEREQPPIGRYHRVIVPSRKQAEVHIMDTRTFDINEVTRQINSISVRAVYKEVVALLRILPRFKENKQQNRIKNLTYNNSYHTPHDTNAGNHAYQKNNFNNRRDNQKNTTLF